MHAAYILGSNAWMLRKHMKNNLKEIKTTTKYHFAPTKMVRIKTTDINKCCEDVGKLEPSHTADGNIKWCSIGGIWQFHTQT